MQPGAPEPGQDPNQPNPYQPYPDYSQPYSTPPAGEQYPTGPAEYSLYPPEPTYPQSAPPAYPPAGYSVPPLAPPQSGNANIFGLLSMIFGIISIPLLCCFYLGVPFGIAAVVLGVLGMNKANAGQANNKGMSIAGIACGAGAIVLVVILIALGIGLNLMGTNTRY